MLDLFECWRRGDDPKMNAGLLLDLTAECTRDPLIARVVRDKDRLVGDGLAQVVRRIARGRGVVLSNAAARDRVRPAAVPGRRPGFARSARSQAPRAAAEADAGAGHRTCC